MAPKGIYSHLLRVRPGRYKIKLVRSRRGNAADSSVDLRGGLPENFPCGNCHRHTR